MANSVNVRLLAFETLLECEKRNCYVKDSLNKTLFQNQFLSKTERGFLSRLVEGTTEYQIRLDYVINIYSKTKINKCKPTIRVLLRMGTYQILFMDKVPDEAACDECVKLAHKKGFHNLTGFINGVLRNIVRNKDGIEYPKMEDNPVEALYVRYSMPDWIVKKMMEWYEMPEVEKILQASVETSDLSVRVNTGQISREDFVRNLQDLDVVVTKGNYVKEAFHLSNINYVVRLPGYKQGYFFVQDESSMLLYEVVRDKLQKMIEETPDRKIDILDVCAAPGGKTTHFAQMLGENGSVQARDLTEKKVALIEENVERLQLKNVECAMADALIFDENKVDGVDVVIADLPCSGLGILGRKNDIKYHIQEEQLQELQQLQRNILKNVMCYVKPGGILLFSTCTINPEENIRNAEWILEQGMYEPLSIKAGVLEELKPCLIQEHMLQLLQGREMCDGFFISAFRRK